jgi:hypothetical protein
MAMGLPKAELILSEDERAQLSSFARLEKVRHRPKIRFHDVLAARDFLRVYKQGLV